MAQAAVAGVVLQVVRLRPQVADVALQVADAVLRLRLQPARLPLPLRLLFLLFRALTVRPQLPEVAALRVVLVVVAVVLRARPRQLLVRRVALQAVVGQRLLVPRFN